MFRKETVTPMAIPPEVTALVQGSGNSFHAKVARSLINCGWHVIVSPYYLDQSQSKAREFDLIAEKLWPIKDMYDRKCRSISLVVIAASLEVYFQVQHR